MVTRRRGAAAVAPPWSPAGAGDVARAAGDTTAQFLGLGLDLLQQGVNIAYQVMGGGCGQPQGSSGWGPVPPPPGAGTGYPG